MHAPVSAASIQEHIFGAKAGSILLSLILAARDVIVPSVPVFWRQAVMPAFPGAAALIVLIVGALGLWWLWALRRGNGLVALLAAWIGANALNSIALAADGYPYSQRYLAVAPIVIALCLGVRALFDMLRCRVPALDTPARRRLAGLLAAAYMAAQGGYTLAGSAACLTPLSFFMAMLKGAPADVVPLGAVAETLNREGGDARDVELCIRRATAIDHTHPQVPRLQNMIIKRYLGDRQYADALRCADWSLTLYPKDSDKMALRAVALASLGAMAEAMRGIDQALVMQPENKGYLLLKQQFLERQRQDAQSVETNATVRE